MPSSSDVIVSDEVLYIFQWLFFSVLTLGIDIFGTIANIINIVCLLKQGFKDMVNISFFGNSSYNFNEISFVTILITFLHFVIIVNHLKCL